MDFICNFCNKKYTTLSSLNHHQKSAKFCLELQKKLDNVETKNKPSVYNCEYCEKMFTTKFSLSKHIDICDNRIYQDKVNNQIKESKLKEEQYLKEKNELEKQILNFQYELKEKDRQFEKVINEKEKQISKLENTITEKDIILVKNLENIIKEKDTIIKEKDAILAKNYDKLADRPNIVNNSTNNEELRSP